jgi:hypothetical protein
MRRPPPKESNHGNIVKHRSYRSWCDSQVGRYGHCRRRQHPNRWNNLAGGGNNRGSIEPRVLVKLGRIQPRICAELNQLRESEFPPRFTRNAR